MLGRKLSLARAKRQVADGDPRGWFKEFCLELVRAKIRAEARAAVRARKLARGETTAWNKYQKLNFSWYKTVIYLVLIVAKIYLCSFSAITLSYMSVTNIITLSYPQST